MNLDILLPEVSDAQDECVTRIINGPRLKRGIGKVHNLLSLQQNENPG
jgi:hypothetical protein